MVFNHMPKQSVFNNLGKCKLDIGNKPGHGTKGWSRIITMVNYGGPPAFPSDGRGSGKSPTPMARTAHVTLSGWPTPLDEDSPKTKQVVNSTLEGWVCPHFQRLHGVFK